MSSGVTRVGDTRGGNRRCHPSIYLTTFLGPSSAVSPLTTFLDDLFCSSLYRFLLLLLGCLVCHPPRGCHPTPFLPDLRPRFSTILCKFAHKIFSFECHRPGGCHPGRYAPPSPPSDATVHVHHRRRLLLFFWV